MRSSLLSSHCMLKPVTAHPILNALLRCARLCRASANVCTIICLWPCRYVELDLDAAEETLGLDCKDESNWVTCESVLSIAMNFIKKCCQLVHFLGWEDTSSVQDFIS